MNHRIDPTSLAIAGRAGVYRSIKTYGHNEGLSCCFRQWRATHSHCRLIHGYALAFKLVFATRDLDERNWCFDFGGLKPVKSWLQHMFDHTMIVAADDPEIARFETLARDGLLDLRSMPAVGCEATAKFVYDKVNEIIEQASAGRVWVESVEVSEHCGNSAVYSLG
jgi:6-pyruvoyltetrahydropterin/6-carboxytetrahydropterin synthase